MTNLSVSIEKNINQEMILKKIAISNPIQQSVHMQSMINQGESKSEAHTTEIYRLKYKYGPSYRGWSKTQQRIGDVDLEAEKRKGGRCCQCFSTCCL